MTIKARQVDLVTPISFAPGAILHAPAFSNTYQVIDGYKGLATSAGAFHSPRYETGAGSMWNWSFGNTTFYRGLLTDRFTAGKVIWAQLVFRTAEGSGPMSTNYAAQVDEVFGWLRGVVGDETPVWVSIVNGYTTDLYPGDGWLDHVIPKADHEAMMARAISEFGCLQGPTDLGPLGVGQVAMDNVHPNSSGQALIGAQLRDFFDPMVVSP